MLVKKLSFFVVYMFIIYKADGSDSCSYPTSDVPSSSCGDVTVTGIEGRAREYLLISINTNRRYNYNGSEQMEWNNDLADLAQKWANQCSTSKLPDGCNPIGGQASVYQLTFEGPDAEFPHEVVRQHWNQEKVIKPTRSSPEHVLLNKVGCGRVEASKGKYLVCYFAIFWQAVHD